MPSTSQIVLTPSQDSEPESDDSDIEMVEEITTKEEPIEDFTAIPPTREEPNEEITSITPKEEPSPFQFFISDVQGSVQEDLFPPSIEASGMAGAITNLYVCNLCDTPFSAMHFVTEHLKKHHKIPKNYQKYVIIKKA